MRKWHRWLSVLFGIFLLWIAGTGVLSQAAVLWPTAEPTAVQRAAAKPPAGFVCPDGWRCSPPRDTTGLRAWTGTFHHLHSGETFGPVGTAISVLSGVALLFFSFSGVWVYVRMWRARRAKRLKGGLFWR